MEVSPKILDYSFVFDHEFLLPFLLLIGMTKPLVNLKDFCSFKDAIDIHLF